MQTEVERYHAAPGGDYPKNARETNHRDLQKKGENKERNCDCFSQYKVGETSGGIKKGNTTRYIRAPKKRKSTNSSRKTAGKKKRRRRTVEKLKVLNAVLSGGKQLQKAEKNCPKTPGEKHTILLEVYGELQGGEISINYNSRSS